MIFKIMGMLRFTALRGVAIVYKRRQDPPPAKEVTTRFLAVVWSQTRSTAWVCLPWQGQGSHLDLTAPGS